MEEILYRFNPWWEGGKAAKGAIEREKYISRLLKLLPLKEVVFITGLRRVGKTTLMKLLIEKLIERGVPPGRIFYISLDFYGLEKLSIIEIVELFYKIQEIPFGEKTYLFLDEVAYKEKFALQLKNIYDLYNAKVYASSSSSSILKEEKALLTGRERVVEVLPLDFFEFLKFRGIEVKKADGHILEKKFERYMEVGGIPQFVLTEDPEYIKQLIDDILYKDIVGRHGVKERSLLRDFFRLLMERAGKQVSVNKLSKVLGISPDTARRFLGYFEETFTVYTVERCGKLNERIKSPKKLYAGDVGIRNAVTGFRDKGAVFENIVYLTIKHLQPCYLQENSVEIDFFTGERLIEVKFNEELREKQRELFERFKAKEKLVITSPRDYLKLLKELHYKEG